MLLTTLAGLPKTTHCEVHLVCAYLADHGALRLQRRVTGAAAGMCGCCQLLRAAPDQVCGFMQALAATEVLQQVLVVIMGVLLLTSTVVNRSTQPSNTYAMSVRFFGAWHQRICAIWAQSRRLTATTAGCCSLVPCSLLDTTAAEHRLQVGLRCIKKVCTSP